MTPAVGPTKKPESSLGSLNLGFGDQNPRQGRSIWVSGARILVRVAQFWLGGPRLGLEGRGLAWRGEACRTMLARSPTRSTAEGVGGFLRGTPNSYYKKCVCSVETKIS